MRLRRIYQFISSCLSVDTDVYIFIYTFSPRSRICLHTFEIFGAKRDILLMNPDVKRFFSIFEKRFLLKSLRENEFETVKSVLLDFDGKSTHEP